LAAAALAALAGCASNPPKPTTQEDAARSAAELPAFATLRALEIRQEQHPDARALDAPLPPGMDESTWAAIPPDELGRATLSLNAALEQLGAGVGAAPASTSGTPATVADERAVKAYVNGRAKLLDGKAAEAIIDLENAVKLDPGAPAAWRELAEAQMQLGRRSAAAQSYQRAVSLGLSEPRAHAVLGREALRARRTQDAVRHLAKARASKDQGPAVQLAVIDTDLSEALLELGYLGAARDAAEEGLSVALTPVSQTRYFADLAEVVRRRGDLWLRAGDLSARLGELDRAGACYAQAAGAPGADQSGLLARRLRVEMVQGRSSAAALVLLEDLSRSGAPTEERHLALIEYLASNSSLGDHLADAIRELSARMPDAPRATRARLAMACAAALPPAEARDELKRYLRESPRDGTVLSELLARCPDTAAMCEDVTELVGVAPLAAGRYAEAVISFGRDVDGMLARVARDASAEAKLLHALLLVKLGMPREAMDVLPEASGPMQGAIFAARTGAAADAARYDEMRRALESLRELSKRDTSIQAGTALFAALAAAQDADGALTALKPFVTPEAAADVDLLVNAAELSMRTGRPVDARDYLLRALDADPSDERSYEGLFTLYAASGPLADERELAAVARRLRQNVPTSRFARLLNAQEQGARSLWPQAQTQLLSLMDAHTEDPQALAALVLVWERCAKSNPELVSAGESWLRKRLDARPQAPQLLAALARAMAAQGKAAEGSALLEERCRVWPQGELARTRERLLRESLDRAPEADALALSRLTAAPRTPDNALELAELLIRRGEFAEAATSIEQGLAPEAPFGPSHAQRLLALLGRLKPEGTGQGEQAEAALRLFDVASARRVPLSPQLLVARVSLLAAAHPEDAPRLVNAISDLGARMENLRLPACEQVYQALAARDDATPSLRFLKEAAGMFSPPNEDLLFEWFRVTVLKGDDEDIARFVRESEPRSMLRLLQKRGQEIELPDDPGEDRAELAYCVALSLSSVGREDRAIPAYRLVLEIDPNHGWACNNLGYILLENGQDPAESERLIEIAYREHEDQYNVVDSLAWVRYLRGQFEDITGPDGRVEREGAVTLLRRAADQLGGDTNPTILDHLADALWRTGVREEAIRRWRNAKAILDATVSQWNLEKQRVPDAAEPQIVIDAREELARINAKISAATDGRDPVVAPTLAEQTRP